MKNITTQNLKKLIRTPNQAVNIITFITCMMFSTACQKFLDAKSNTTLVVPSTLNDLQGLLDDATRMNNGTTPSFLETAADDYFIPPNTYATLPVLSQNVYQWKTVDYNNGSDWSKPYLAIYNSNIALEQLGKIVPDATNLNQWNHIKGSALFYRSYYYLWLAWSFAKAFDATTADKDLGIVLKTTTNFNEPSIRAPVKETYQKIITDTKEAISLLPGLPAREYRPSKAGAYGLLARTYWSMRDYENSLKYADSCLVMNNSLINYNSDADINGSMAATAPFKQFNKETIFYTEMSRAFPILHLSNTGKIDTLLYGGYSANDLRKTGFFRANSGYQIFKGSYSGGANSTFTGIATDEILLIRAECLIREGNINKGLNDINRLLLNRYKTGTYTPFSTSDPAVALDFVLTERRKELVMRGLRWIDIKRLNKEEKNIIPRRKGGEELINLEPNSAYYALPLPADIVRITGMKQN